MNFKKKSLILSILFILTIQVLLLINNKQKTSLRYFVWNIEEVSIGRLIVISFVSGLLISSFIDKTLNNGIRSYQNNEEYTQSTSERDYSLNGDDGIDSSEIPPERDLRDTQPTISVNYRVIKENSENDTPNSKQRSNKKQSMTIGIIRI